MRMQQNTTAYALHDSVYILGAPFAEICQRLRDSFFLISADKNLIFRQNIWSTF